MQDITISEEFETITTRVTDPPLSLFISAKAFRPNPTTVRFSRTVKVSPGDLVFDIGTGVGPLAIMAAMAGASHVHAVDPVPLHCDLARRNVAKYNLTDRISVHEGVFFEPFETSPGLLGLKADVIIGDVSGIATPIARALGWYSDQVPTGGGDGTEVIISLLRSARKHLAPTGRIYFPIAVDLSDSEKIFNAARALFRDVSNAMDRPTTTFPLCETEVRALRDAYPGQRPKWLTIQDEHGRRPHWRGQIWQAASPIESVVTAG